MKKRKTISRRDFLKIIAVSGVAGFTAKYGLDSLIKYHIVSETRLLMGTIINIKAVGSDPETASAAINACLDRMSVLEGVLSRFQPKSQLSRLNQVGMLEDAHPTLVSLIQKSKELSQLTDGAFDITVKPLLDLYQTSETLPTEEQIQSNRSLVDYRNLNVENQSVSFKQKGMSITLDGIAKGFIVDEGVAVLRQYGFENVMVEAGGDLMGLGENSLQSPWKIGLQSPRGELGSLITTITVKSKALATSGDYMQAFSQDFVHHHIIDPRTGHSSLELASVSVIAPTVVQADGLATAIMVLGQDGIWLAEKLPSCEAYAIGKNLDIFKTDGFITN